MDSGHWRSIWGLAVQTAGLPRPPPHLRVIRRSAQAAPKIGCLHARPASSVEKLGGVPASQLDVTPTDLAAQQLAGTQLVEKLADCMI
jgi:hypothetical protein